MNQAIKLSRRTLLMMPAPLALAACDSSPRVTQLRGNTMGTQYSVIAVDHARKHSEQDLQAAVDGVLGQVNREMSNWDTGSDISMINAQGGTHAISSGLDEVLSTANLVHEASDGQFDVTMGPLIDLWGFGPSGQRSMTPSNADIDAALQRVGYGQNVTVANGNVTKTQGSGDIILSAIGKGHGVDRVARELRSMGIEDFLVEIGGDLYTSGRNANGLPWQIGVETPEVFDSSVQQVVGVTGQGMATSGDYRNYFEQGGVRYSHMLDTKTGRPVTHTTASATVITENAMLADAWSTAMLVLGRERGLEIAEERNLAVLFIERQGTGPDMQFVTTQSSTFVALYA